MGFFPPCCFPGSPQLCQCQVCGVACGARWGLPMRPAAGTLPRVAVARTLAVLRGRASSWHGMGLSGVGRGYGLPKPCTLPWKHSQALLLGDTPHWKKCWKTSNKPIPSSRGWPGGAGGAVAPYPPTAVGTPSALCPQAAPQGEVSPGAGWDWGCPDLAKPQVGVIKELMRSRRDALPSRAGFRQWPRPNPASVARSEAGAVPMRAAVMESSPARHPWHNDSGAARMDGQKGPA